MATKNTSPFDLEKALIGSPVMTTDGRKAVVAGYNANAAVDEAVIGWVDGQAYWWRADGKNVEDKEASLVMVSATKKIYSRLRISSSGVPVYKTVEEADRELLNREPESHERWVWAGPIEEKEIPDIMTTSTRVVNSPVRPRRSRMHRKTGTST